MILKALYDYYHRCDALPKQGLELKEIGFLLVISPDGKFLRFEDRRIDKNSAQSFLVKKSVSRTVGVVSNLFYDNSAYVFCYSDKGDEEKIRKNYDCFKALVEDVYKILPNNRNVKAVYNFYQQDISVIQGMLQEDPLWKEIIGNLSKKYANFSFLVEGETEIVAANSEVINSIAKPESENGESVCLVTGNKGRSVEITTATMIPGSQATAKLVAFQVKSGYDSYGKEKGNNAPISEEAEFAYTTALNKMLEKDSHNKFSIGNRTYLFWASCKNEAAIESEESLYTLFGQTDENDNPNRRIEIVKNVFMSIFNGKIPTAKDDKFFILGLAPNSARIAVVYWAEIPIKDFAGMIIRHFDDMEIIDTRKDGKPYAGLHSMIGAVTLRGKLSEATPNLPDAVVKSIFQGLPYPMALYQACIRRIRAEQEIAPYGSPVRMAIIKAYLNRLNENNNNNKIEVMLDKENTNKGYLCGRLFAVLENLQYAANGQDSIRTSYMNAASSTPSSVFSTIMKLSNNHFSKLAKDKKGLALFFDGQKQEILAELQDIPDTFDLLDQGRFFLGYYHQKNYKENKENQD